MKAYAAEEWAMWEGVQDVRYATTREYACNLGAQMAVNVHRRGGDGTAHAEYLAVLLAGKDVDLGFSRWIEVSEIDIEEGG